MNNRATGAAGELCARLWDEGVVVVQDAPLVLKSGRVTHVYVNFRDFALAPENLGLMARVFSEWLAASGLAMPEVMLGAASSLLSPFLAGALARECGLPVALHRPGTEERGLSDRVFHAGRNPSCQGQPPRQVILVDDVASTGGTLRAAARDFAQAGLGEAQAFVFVDKRRASERDKTGIEVHAPLTLVEILAQGLEEGRAPALLAGKVKAEMVYLGG